MNYIYRAIFLLVKYYYEKIKSFLKISISFSFSFSLNITSYKINKE